MSEIAESFASSLSELTVNSKPHINMLTMLADDHQEYAGVITETILSHLEKVRPEVKLPVLYLIDSIVKNVGKGYINLFSQSIVSTFSNTFEKVDEKTREQMFKLRQTWSEVFPVKIMFALDTKVQKIDPAWPVTAPPSTVHLNPKFFKSPDALDSKSLTPISQADMPLESRSRHRKSKSYSRSRSVTNSTHSKKAPSNNSSSSADSVPVAKLTAPPPPEQLREQMIMKQKLLLELQQKKLKLELLQTQAQLEEQQKQLEKHSINHKATAELSKLQKMVSEEEAKLKTMSKNLKKQVQLKKPKLQQIHRVTSEMKAQKVTDISKVTVAPESMVKQSALLELSKEETGSKISKPLPPKSKVVHIQHQPVAEKPKVVAVADPIEDAPPPVRIAPVSSQLINAALTFGRNPRDPRIRQMSSRIESQLNASVPQTPITSAPSPIPPPVTNPVKKPEGVTENKNVIKPRKDKKSSSHQHKEQRHSKSSEEDSKNYSHSISSSRNREKSSNRSSNKPEKSPPSKKLEENPDKTKAEELFTFTKSKSAVKARLHIHSPSKSHNKRDKPDISDFTEITKTSYERVSRIESSPKRSKLQENWLENDDSSDFVSAKHVHKLNMDIAKSQNIRHSDTLNINKASVLADSSSEMPFEDIEKIVRHPDIVTKPIKQIEFGPKSDEFVESPKSSDDSIESKFDDIIKNPSKNATFDRTSKVPGDKSNLLKAFLPDIQTDVSLHKDEINTVSISEKANELIAPKSPEKVIKTTINRNMETYEKPLDLELIQNNSIKVSQQKTVSMPQIVPDAVELDNDIIPRIESLFDHEKPTQPESIFSKPQEIEVSTTLTSFPDYDKNTKIISQERRSSEEEKNIPEPNLIESPQEQPDSLRFPLGTKMGDSVNSQTQIAMTFSPKDPEITEHLSSFKISEKLALSPKKTLSPVKLIEPMEIIHETNEDPVSDMEYLPQNKSDRRHGSPVQQEKNRKGEKPTLMEQVITDAETHDSSPSPPPPPAVSDKFKEIKQSSLSRLRRVGRSREDQEDSESPEPADVDLRTQIQPPSLTKDLKNEVLGLGEKDVDLRNLPGSPTKKRPSMEKLLDIPPAKKSKAEVMDELFGSEDVDLRPVLCPPPPSPPPPPVISSSPPPDAGGERLWARYKQAKPDTYKAKYTPSRRDRAPSVDRFGRTFRHSVSEDGNAHSQSQSRNRMNFEDIDMRAQPTVAPDYDHIIRQAINQHQRGDLNYDAYKRVLTEVVGMSEKQKLEEAQRLEHADNQPEQLDPISDDDISGGSLSGVEDAPSPTASYSGGEDTEDPLFKKTLNEDKNITATEPEKILSEKHGDVDIRMPPADVDIRIKIDYLPKKDQEVMPGDEKLSRKSRGVSPYSRKPGEPEHERYRSRRDELKALRREKKARREEDDLTRYRKPRYSEDSWESHSRRSQLAEKAVDMDSPRVPPLPQYDSDLNYREPTLPQFTKEPDVGSLRPGPAPAPWDQPRMAAPAPGPWMTPPLLRGPPGMGMRPQDRFMGPRWRHNPPGMFDSDPRFNRFRMPPIPPRFPPLVPCEVPPTDPAVLKLIEEDPTKSINIDGMPRDIRFYGSIAVALMNWDDPCEVTFQPGQRRVIIDDRDNIIVHFNAPPIEVLIDGQSHRIRFGAPTRELYIDNQWYEAYFGGPPVTLDIAGKPHTVQLEGPPPAVRPGVQRKDLVVGRVTLVIDAEMLFTVFLDAKPQKFEVKGVAYIIRFVEALQKTVINGVAFKSDFGGLPKPIILNGTKHFFRLTALPRGVTPGFLTIVNMEGGRLPSPPTLPAPPQLPASLEQAVDFKPELKADPFLQPPMPILPTPPMVPADMLTRDVDKSVVPPPPIPPLTMSAIEPLKPPPAVNSLDLLANLMPVPEPSRAVEYNYSVENENSNHKAPSTTAAADTTTTSAPILGGEINVTELLQKLMATGIVPSLDKPKDKTAEKQITADTSLIKPVDFRKPDTLKIRQSALVSHLYSGIQCNSCGVRFPPEQTMKYSQHLDWHFRQNRRDKDSTRTAQTRRYYYDVNDWVQFEEIEDLEERAQPWFEMQEGDAEEEEHPQVLVSVRSADYPDEAACFICNDKFESFYNEEKEEWHLRNAVDQDGKLVHPVCLEDQRAAAEKPIVVEDIDITEDEPKEEEEVKEKEETPSKIEDDDDIMEVTDIEFIKPVFPVEDLTVSDSESVADDTEEKPKAAEEEVNEKVEEDQPEEKTPSNTEDVDADTTTTEVNDLPQEPEESKEEESEVIENDSKSEDTQDDLVILDKGEDSALSTAEILEVVRKIKKDPDILGGEYEEIGLDPNIEIKKEKGEVPLPQPVVDTTHTSVTCLIDGNVEFEETPPQINVGGPTKIKINITKPSVQTATKETTKEDIEVVEDEARNTASPATKCLALVNQPPPPGEEPVPLYVKPKLIGRKLQDLPPVLKGSELSGLCSIM